MRPTPMARAAGESFTGSVVSRCRVTRFDRTTRVVLGTLFFPRFLSRDRLVLGLDDGSSNIWMVENFRLSR